MPVTIIQDVRPMVGHTKPKLMRGDDEHFYVVKFQSNPLGRRALINDWIASNIALGIGLEVAKPEIVQVPEWLATHGGRTEATAADIGPQFGSRFVADPQQSQVVDYFPEKMTNAAYLTNIDIFSGALVLDYWLRNVDSRQFVFYRYKERGRAPYTAVMIDQTGCLGGTLWAPGSINPGQRLKQGFYRNVSLDIAERWLSHIQAYPEDSARYLVQSVPPSWIQPDDSEILNLIEQLWNSKPTLSDMEKLIA